MLGALLALGALLRITPPAKGQFTPPALPGTFGDIATPSVAPPTGATRVYTKNGTACALSPIGVETCTGSGGGGGSITAPYFTLSSVTYAPIWQVTVPPLTGWTAQNSATLDTTNGFPYISNPSTASATQIRGITRASPTAPYSVTMLLYHDISGQGTTGSSTIGWSIGFSDGTKLVTADMSVTSGTTFGPFYDHWSTITGGVATAQNNSDVASSDLILRNPGWLKLCDDSTNIKIFFALDGGSASPHWKQVYTELRGAFLTTAPSQIFVGAEPINGIVEDALISYKETAGAGCP